MKNEVYEEIETLINFAMVASVPGSTVYKDAERVEAWLATLNPENL